MGVIGGLIKIATIVKRCGKLIMIQMQPFLKSVFTVLLTIIVFLMIVVVAYLYLGPEHGRFISVILANWVPWFVSVFYGLIVGAVVSYRLYYCLKK